MDIASQLAKEEAAMKSIREETEDAYYQAYNSLTFEPQPGEPSRGKNVAFVVHAASLLAHVQLMRGVLRKQDYVIVLSGSAEGFRNLLPATVICLPDVPLAERFEAMRDRLKANQIGTLIWVSLPLYARHAFGLRLAERQVFWAMRYHPIAPGDLNITAGNRGEKTRTFHGKEWACVHAPFNVELKKVDRIRCENQRAPYSYIYGTLAREQKLSPEYLEAVAAILHAHSEAGFVWTGRQERPPVRQFFRSRGLSNRQWFAGWVDPDDFVNTLDCFIETFPLGGLTTFAAMGHGIPVVAMRQEHSPVGSIDAHQGLLAASGHDEYVRMALSMQDRAKRQAAVEAGHRALHLEIAAAEKDRQQFWRVIQSQ